ncbi:MAG: DegT/DnrJ/EryC1/StrS aminotransferase family protein [Candidatus Obscuribacterales bacterium]|nr:DegT/DnrJ/EryC1/StrS aminotransferase family protein [Candidatus Obscuribacterales bacterium]
MVAEVMSTLAIDGGKPVRDEFLAFHKPNIGPAEEAEVIDALRSGWLTTGPKTKKFEREFADFVGAKHGVAVNSCTAALHVALLAAGVGTGDEVITSPITFASTANVIVHSGATPVFVDVEPETLNLDPAKLEAAITPRTKVIIPVHFAGHPCDMDEIKAIADKHKLTIIEDAAHSPDAHYKGKRIGSISPATCFSFYATKNITTGEGGMLTTDDQAFAEKCAILALHGISKDAWKRYSSSGYQHWDILDPGFKYNMFDLQAALGLVQLKRVDEFWTERKRQFEFYGKAFADLPEITLPIVRDYVKSSYHLYVIQVKTEELGIDRDTFMNALQAENIGIGIHFRAVHLHPYYKNTFGFAEGMFPNAEYASDRVISLPLYPGLPQADMELVAKAVHKLVQHYRANKKAR